MPRGIYTPGIITDTSNLTEEAWLEFRRDGIGGSEVATIMGESPFNTARDVFYDKKRIKPMIDEEDNWLAKKIGHLLESVVAELFEKKTGLTVVEEKTMFFHPLHPFMFADVDFLIITADGRRGILECKTSNHNNRDKWANDSLPYNYELQGRHYMSVLNLDFVYFACLFGNSESDFVYRYMARDFDIEDSIILEEQYFWENYILKNIEPPYVEKGDMVLKSIQRHFGLADKTLSGVNIAKNYAKELEKIIALKDKKSKIDKESETLDNQIKQAYAPIVDILGNSCSGTCLSGKSKYEITYNPVVRTGITGDNLARLKEQNPAIYNDFVGTSESRTFRIKKKEVA